MVSEALDQVVNISYLYALSLRPTTLTLHLVAVTTESFAFVQRSVRTPKQHTIVLPKKHENRFYKRKIKLYE